MRVAVTGATGFVGGHLVDSLTREGHEVIPFDRSGLEGHQYWDIERGEFTDPPHVDAVVHCAASVNDWNAYGASYRGNVTGTANVLVSFKNTPLFIHISSASVYDSFTHESVLTEDSPCGQYLNAYSKTKREAELLVMNATQERRIILRPHVIYGKGDTKILPRLLRARRFGRFLVIGNGKNIISLTHIENLAHAVSCSLSTQIPKGCEIFNITDDGAVSIDEVLTEIRRVYNIDEPLMHVPRTIAFALGFLGECLYRLIASKHPPLITRYAVAQMAYSHRLSVSKAQKMLHYKPEWNYKRGFQELCYPHE